MNPNDGFARAYQRFAGASARPPSLMQKIVTVVSMAAVFTLMLMASVVLFAAVAAVGVVAWGWLWWKTRDVRKQMRAHPPGGLVLEGEVIREVSVEDDAFASTRRDHR